MSENNNKQFKQCRGCSIEKPIDCFYKKPSGKYGVEAYCCECRLEIKHEYYVKNKADICNKKKEYRFKNIEKFKLADKKYQENNKGKIAQRRKGHYEENRERILREHSEYYIKNKDRIETQKKKYRKENKTAILIRERKFYQDNKEKIAQRYKDYYIRNSEKIKAKNIINKEARSKQRKQYYIRNAERLRAIGIENYKKNPERFKLQKKAYAPIVRKKEREAYKNNPYFRLNQLMRGGIYGALGVNKQGRKWESLVDYDLEILKNHLTKLMKKYNKLHPDEKDMSWGNYGEWQIDHKIPKSVFNYTKPEHEDFKRCWNLSNLQPLWKIDNIRKRAKIDKPFQPQLALG